MSAIGAFAHLILDVESVEASLGFYHGRLGFPVSAVGELDGHRLATISANGFEILLLQQPPEDRNAITGRGKGLVLNFRVVGLREMAQQLKRTQVTVLQDLEEVSFGDRTFLIADPDGYAILLSEPVGNIH